MSEAVGAASLRCFEPTIVMFQFDFQDRGFTLSIFTVTAGILSLMHAQGRSLYWHILRVITEGHSTSYWRQLTCVLTMGDP